jgi:hypothetical protein
MNGKGMEKEMQKRGRRDKGKSEEVTKREVRKGAMGGKMKKRNG